MAVAALARRLLQWTKRILNEARIVPYSKGIADTTTTTAVAAVVAAAPRASVFTLAVKANVFPCNVPPMPCAQCTEPCGLNSITQTHVHRQARKHMKSVHLLHICATSATNAP